MIVHACWLGLALVVQVPPPTSATRASTDLRQQRRAIVEEEAGRLAALADRLDGQEQAAAAKEVRARIEPEPAPDGPTRFVPLLDVVPASAPRLASVPARPEAPEPWRADLRTTREGAAGKLFALAERAAAATPRHYALAVECLRAVVDRQPDHAEARRLLGYVPHERGWATPYAVAELRAGKVDHPTFGWVDRSWLPHLARGELPAPPGRGQGPPRWVPAAEADALHSAWRSAWRIRTEHFLIQSNAPFSEAIAFGRRLEAFHDLFSTLLADVLAADDRFPLARRFVDKSLAGEKPAEPHQVDYFKEKQEYVDYLAPMKGPGIAESLGIYIPPRPGRGRRAPAYFFRDPGAEIESTATLFHEVSHQLLFEAGGASPGAYTRNVGHYWVFEGLGTYFESIVLEPDGSMLVGGLVGPRIKEARYRLLEKHEFVPTESLVRLGEAGFNRDEVVHLHYAESMALAVFLMQARGREYREAFLDYVKDAYRGRLRPDAGRPLDFRLGIPYSTLDAQFLEFLRKG